MDGCIGFRLITPLSFLELINLEKALEDERVYYDRFDDTSDPDEDEVEDDPDQATVTRVCPPS